VIPTGSLSGNTGSSYMLKLQKYKKMKAELASTTSTKNLSKKVLHSISYLL